jgi:Tfp pilus assembly protein PilV
LRPPARRPLARRRRAGFTLAEVTLATAILAAAITTSIGVIQWGMRHLDLARGTTLAAQILQSEIERIRMMGWEKITAIPREATVPLSSAFSSDATIAQGFTLTRKVDPDMVRPNDIRRITVTVRWNTTDGIAHSRSFIATYVRLGINDYFYTLSNP